MNNVNNKKIKNYSTASDYQVLGDIEHIRKRPGNYIGSTDERGWQHLFQEIIDNSIDEAVAGNCSNIIVSLSKDQKWLTIEDNGHGIPIEIHQKTKKSVLVTLFSLLKSGGKFDDKIYKTSGGLHGIGVTAVNALSERLIVENYREGKTQKVIFSRGILISEEIVVSANQKDGVKISFLPDKEIFKEFTHFRVENIEQRLKELAYLNPNITITLINEGLEENKTKEFHYEEGLTAWIKESLEDNFLEGTTIFEEESSLAKPYFYINFAWRYRNVNSSRPIHMTSFCNNISTIGGGTHVEGFELGFVNAVREWIKLKNPSLKNNILKEDVINNLFVIINVRVKEPQFLGQTKSSLTDKYIKDIVKNIVHDYVYKFLQDHRQDAEIINDIVLENSIRRVKIEEFQHSIRENKSVFVPNKLAPCISKNSEETEIFIVEGESAGGSAKMARNPRYQAILPVQGKIINVEKADDKNILLNKEIKNIVNSLGFNVSEIINNNFFYYSKYLDDPDFINLEEGLKENTTFTNDEGKEVSLSKGDIVSRNILEKIVEISKVKLLSKLKYKKVIIMTDADPDGKHIECLSLIFFSKYFRFLIEAGSLYLAVPPLFKIGFRKESVYIYSDKELEEFKISNPNTIIRIQRFKGLGEMNPSQLRETAMSVTSRCLYNVVFSDPIKTYLTIDELMGSNSKYRKIYLENKSYREKQLIVYDNNVFLEQALLIKFLSYAYEVIEERALPEEDGLKPVQRKILFTLFKLNLFPNKPYRKSAKIVGDVIGKYHPHGDQSVYQAMVKMSQDFHFRYPLIDGQGNWGSIDGDSAAQMRYTEARLSKFGAFLLEDLYFDTVEWKKNYDETEEEPKILPPNLNLLLNGSNGIAVGMNTNIPSHNILELITTTIKLIEQPYIEEDELLEFLPGPDLPTGGIILEKSKLKNIYKTGEGTFYIRSKIEDFKGENNEKSNILVITELPYKVNKLKLVEEISNIIKNKKIEGIKSIEDFSSLEKPVNIQLKIDANYDKNIIINKLYKQTELQSSFSVKIRSIINKEPKLLSVKEILDSFIDWRLEHLKRKATFLYKKNNKELLSLNTKLFIINNYKKIADILSSSADEEEAKKSLLNVFKISEDEIERILDIPSYFRQFTSEKKHKLEQEIENIKTENDNFIKIIESEDVRRHNLIEELLKIKEDYKNDKRRTLLIEESSFIQEKQLITNEERVVVLSTSESSKDGKKHNYITIYNNDFIEPTRLKGKGKNLKLRGNGWAIFKIFTKDVLVLFSNKGKMYKIDFYKINVVGKTINLDEELFTKVDPENSNIYSILDRDEYFTNYLVLEKDNDYDSLVIITNKNKVKKIGLDYINNTKKRGKVIIKKTKVVITKCENHIKEVVRHKEESEKCSLLCTKCRDIKNLIKECSNCIKEIVDNEESITNIALTRETDDIYAIAKKKIKNNLFKNLKVSIYKNYRKKTLVNIEGEERVVKSFCPYHVKSNIEHIKNHIKNSESCNNQCLFVVEKIRKCNDCKHDSLFEKKIRKINKDLIVFDIINVNPANYKNNNLLIVKDDNNLEKKIFSNSNNIANDFKILKIRNCERHWIKKTEIEDNYKRISTTIKIDKNELKNDIINSDLSSKDKIDKLLKFELSSNKIKALSLLSNNNEKKDNYLSDLARENIIDILDNKNRIILENINELNTEKENLLKNKEEISSCKNCSRYCNKHIDKLKKSKENHKNNCDYCFVLESEYIQVKEAIESADKQENFSKLAFEKLINIKKSKLNKLLAANNNCEILKSLKLEISKCDNCISKQKESKTIIISKKINRVIVYNNEGIEKYNLYLLFENNLCCFFNKDDLSSLLNKKNNGNKSLDKNKDYKVVDAFFSSKKIKPKLKK